jgi:hypothetical protein
MCYCIRARYHSGRLLGFWKFNAMQLKNQEPAGRFLIIGLITGSKLSNHSALGCIPGWVCTPPYVELELAGISFWKTWRIPLLPNCYHRCYLVHLNHTQSCPLGGFPVHILELSYLVHLTIPRVALLKGFQVIS